jgi:DMSO/TMAO reductase YedYZ molybdopterin-dependent catalytic subunit
MRRIRRLANVWPAIVGGLVAVAVTLLLRTALGTRLLPEIVVDATTYVLGGEGFSTLLSIFEEAGKPLLFVSVLLAELAVYVLAWALVGARVHSRYGVLASFAVSAVLPAACLLVVSAALVALPETSLGSETSWPGYAIAALIASISYALVVGLFTSAQAGAPSDAAADDSRRALLLRLSAAALGGVAIVFTGREVLRSSHGGVQSSNEGKPTPEITSNRDFYLVSKNLIDPTVSESHWRLRVGGLTERELELTYTDLLALPVVEQYTTLQCISNEVGGYLMSNAQWKGVPLRRVIEMAGPKPGAAFVAFRSEDDYTESLALQYALKDGVILAHTMNGEPLPQKHGFPVRLLSPGKYGIKNPKWITEITLLKEDRYGFWVERGWNGERMNTSSRIDVPKRNKRVPQEPLRIQGIAFSGDRGISKVEVSLDGGSTWREAVLKPALGPYTWLLWHYDWRDLPKSGLVRILARATDGAGEVQTSIATPPFPSGATGYPLSWIVVGSQEAG